MKLKVKTQAMRFSNTVHTSHDACGPPAKPAAHSPARDRIRFDRASQRQRPGRSSQALSSAPRRAKAASPRCAWPGGARCVAGGVRRSEPTDIRRQKGTRRRPGCLCRVSRGSRRSASGQHEVAMTPQPRLLAASTLESAPSAHSVRQPRGAPRLRNHQASSSSSRGRLAEFTVEGICSPPHWPFMQAPVLRAHPPVAPQAPFQLQP